MPSVQSTQPFGIGPGGIGFGGGWKVKLLDEPGIAHVRNRPSCDGGGFGQHTLDDTTELDAAAEMLDTDDDETDELELLDEQHVGLSTTHNW